MRDVPRPAIAQVWPGVPYSKTPKMPVRNW